MVRTTFSTCLVLYCCLALQAEEVTNPKVAVEEPQAAKTLGKDDGASKLEMAVHVNASEIEGTSSLRSATGAATRLRSVRDSVFVPAAPAGVKTGNPGSVPEKIAPTTKPDSDNTSADTLETSSRRGQSSSPATTSLELNASGPSPSDAATPAKKILPSVVKRRGKSTPEIAGPTLALPLGSLTESVAAEENPTVIDTTNSAPSAVPTLAAPSLAEPAPVAAKTTTPATTPQRPQPLKPLDITPIAQVPRQSTAATEPASAEPRVAALDDALTPLSKPIKLDPQVPFNNINIQPENVQFEPRATVQPKAITPIATRSPSQSPAAEQPAEDPQDAEGKMLLSNRSPVLIVRTHGQQTIRVGRSATYYITAANAGDLRAEDVMVTVNVPNWAELARNQATSGLVRVEPNANGDNVMKWSIRDLEPGAKQRLKLDLIPRASRPIDLGVTWNFKSVSAMAQIEVQEAKLQMSVVGPADIQYADTKLYTITVSNPGTGDAENVVLTLLPINDGGGSAGVRELGDIKAGTRRTIEVELTARQAGDLAVRASVTGDGGLKAQSEQKVRVRRANLVVEASGPAKRYAGTEARFAVKVMNNGDAIARDIVAVAAMPMAAEYVSSSGGGVFDPDRGQVRWSIGALRPGAFQVLELSTTLMGAGSNRLEVRTLGANQLSAVGEVLTQVEAVSDLKLYVDDPPGVLSIGTEMSYELRIVNRGTRAAHNVDVVGYFSEGIEPVAIRGWKGDVEVGQVVLETIPRIAPGQEFAVKVIAVASRSGDHVFRTEVHARDDSRTKLAVDEWTRFDGGELPMLDGAAERQAELPGPIELDEVQR